MGKLIDILKATISLGQSPQTFLGAKWIRAVMKRAPEPRKRVWALRLLWLSPHYFIDPENPEFKGLKGDVYLEKALSVGRVSRQRIFDQIVRPYVTSDDVVIDYGCGPGFLSLALASNVRRVYGCDISEGALESARILNSAPNLEYLVASNGLSPIENGSCDVIVSFAMAQHLTADALDHVLDNCQRKLRSGGKLVLHVELLNNGWRTEADWKADRSVRGRLRFRYGLHCFGRTADTYRLALQNHGFTDIELRGINDIVPEKSFEGLGSQHLFTARKA